MMKYGFSNKQLKEIVSFFREYSEVEEAVLFGSRAIDTYKEASDVDIALKGNNVTASLSAKMKFNIEEDTYLPFFFDFIAYSIITSEELKQHIRNKGVVIYRRMGEWKECKLGDFTEINMGQSPKSEFYNDYGKGLPFLQGNRTFGIRYPSFDTYCSNPKKIANEGEILFSVRAPVGDINIANRTICIGRGLASLNAKNKQNLFLFYLLHFIKSDIINSESGTVYGSINKNILETIEILLPPLPEQKAIAAVLSSLDDKIDLLHRQNKTLEAMVETLFRQWFIEESQDDWEDGCLGDVVELIYGKGLKKEIRTGTGYPVIGSSGVVGYHSDFLVKGPGIVIGRKGTLGKVIYLWDNFFPIDTTYYIKSKFESAGLLYEYFLLKTLNFEEMNSDSAVPGLNRDIALSTEIKIVPLEKLHKFNQFSSTFIDKLRANGNQIRTLEKLRDTLLPKLMSGEVRDDENVVVANNYSPPPPNTMIKQETK